MHSPYMEFAKLHSGAKYNLATSGIMSYPLEELPVRVEDLEINGPGSMAILRCRSASRVTTEFRRSAYLRPQGRRSPTTWPWQQPSTRAMKC